VAIFYPDTSAQHLNYSEKQESADNCETVSLFCSSVFTENKRHNLWFNHWSTCCLHSHTSV